MRLWSVAWSTRAISLLCGSTKRYLPTTSLIMDQGLHSLALITGYGTTTAPSWLSLHPRETSYSTQTTQPWHRPFLTTTPKCQHLPWYQRILPSENSRMLSRNMPSQSIPINQNQAILLSLFHMKTILLQMVAHHSKNQPIPSFFFLIQLKAFLPELLPSVGGRSHHAIFQLCPTRIFPD